MARNWSREEWIEGWKLRPNAESGGRAAVLPTTCRVWESTGNPALGSGAKPQLQTHIWVWEKSKFTYFLLHKFAFTNHNKSLGTVAPYRPPWLRQYANMVKKNLLTGKYFAW